MKIKYGCTQFVTFNKLLNKEKIECEKFNKKKFGAKLKNDMIVE